MSVSMSVSWSAHVACCYVAMYASHPAFRGLTLRRVLRTSSGSRKTEYCIISELEGVFIAVMFFSSNLLK